MEKTCIPKEKGILVIENKAFIPISRKQVWKYRERAKGGFFVDRNGLSVILTEDEFRDYFMI